VLSYKAKIVMTTSGQDLTALLQAWSDGEESALPKLADAVYAELKRRAHWYMANERPGHTLETCALINEAFLELASLTKIRGQNRTHFYSMAARMMRRVLVDYAVSRNYKKRGGGAQPIALDEACVVSSHRCAEFITLDEALERLATFDRRKSEIVELRFFGGFSVEEIAQMLSVSTITVLRDWKLAKAWLEREIAGGTDGTS
jgi:RNA polymerase sigma factor (TIGR02999 family)